MNHFIRPAAKDDIIRQFRYYLLQVQVPEVAIRFVDAVDETVALICASPLAGSPKTLTNRSLAGLRSWAVKGFEDILIFYLAEPERVRIVRVLHGRRDISKILEEEQDDAIN